jgi:hypothetical protein
MGAVSLFAQEGATKAGEGTLMPDALTIFVKPENGGSEVKTFTEGLFWDRQ